MGRGGRVKRYPEEFKQSVVELALSGEKPITQLAVDLGMSDKTLHSWLRQYHAKNENRLKTNTDESLESELKRLRKENAILKKERDILKKATAPQGHFFQGTFFSKEAH